VHKTIWKNQRDGKLQMNWKMDRGWCVRILVFGLYGNLGIGVCGLNELYVVFPYVIEVSFERRGRCDIGKGM